MKCKYGPTYSDKCGYHNCPSGRVHNNDWCDIRPEKNPKPKMVRVKAWAFKADGTGYDASGWHCVPEQYDGTVPCTILIDKKYLKEAK